MREIERELTVISDVYSYEREEELYNDACLSWSKQTDLIRLTRFPVRKPMKRAKDVGEITPVIQSARNTLQRWQQKKRAMRSAKQRAKKAETKAEEEKKRKKSTVEEEAVIEFRESPWQRRAFVRRAMVDLEKRFQELLGERCRAISSKVGRDDRPLVKRQSSFSSNAVRTFKTATQDVTNQLILPNLEHQEETEVLKKISAQEPTDKAPEAGSSEESTNQSLVNTKSNEDLRKKPLKLTRSWSGLKNMTDTCVAIRNEVKDAVANLELSNAPVPISLEPETRGSRMATEHRAHMRKGSTSLKRILQEERLSRSTADRLKMERNTQDEMIAENVEDSESDDDDVELTVDAYIQKTVMERVRQGHEPNEWDIAKNVF
jgi:hypothetical protein